MPRRRKPPGYERWTWAEINAGRRMSKSEKRWRRVAKDLNWDQRSDGNYVAPPHAQPILFIIIALMVVLGVLAPNGLNNARGEVVVAALIVFFLLAGAMLLLVLVGANEPAARQHTGSGSTTDPVPFTWSSNASTPRSQCNDTPTSDPLNELHISVAEPQAPRRPSGGVRGLVGALLGLLSSRWVYRLPDWLQPIIWACVITSPALAFVARWRSSGLLATDVGFCLAFVAAGCTLGGLAYDGFWARRARREVEDAERAQVREKFRATLRRELKTRSVREFDFSSLVAEHGTSRFEADAAAAVVYRRFSDRVVVDGVITAEERTRMDMLARMLEIGPERVAVIEAAAKSERFRGAVDEVLADGVVTQEEKQDLEALRISLGIDGADWSKGQDRVRAAKLGPSSGNGGARDA